MNVQTGTQSGKLNPIIILASNVVRRSSFADTPSRESMSEVRGRRIYGPVSIREREPAHTAPIGEWFDTGR